MLAASDRDVTTASVLAWHGLAQVIAFERADEADAALAEVARSVRFPAYERIAQTIIDACRAMLLARFSDDADQIQRSLDVLPWESPFLRFDFSVIASLAEAVAVAGDAQRARSLHASLEPYGHRVSSTGRSGFACFGPIDGAIGLLAGTTGSHDEAIERLERAIAVADGMGLRIYAADARYWQGRFLCARGGPGDVERARDGVDKADAVARSLGLGRMAARIGGLRAALAGGAPPVVSSRVAPRGLEFKFTREGEYWTVSAPAGTARVRDSRGVQMLATLVAQPGRELHVLTLMGSGSDSEAVDGGDAGELLDEEAIADYRERLKSLEDELSQAEGWADAGRAARARAEREGIAQELSRGVGLGGRGRRAGAAAERARVNVQRRIRGAIRKIGEGLPELGSYLDRTVRTGTFCSYEPF
ncbi:MAG: hypothetical protein ABI560_19475 [Myxococcales bacterium]